VGAPDDKGQQIDEGREQEFPRVLLFRMLLKELIQWLGLQSELDGAACHDAEGTAIDESGQTGDPRAWCCLLQMLHLIAGSQLTTSTPHLGRAGREDLRHSLSKLLWRTR